MPFHHEQFLTILYTDLQISIVSWRTAASMAAVTIAHLRRRRHHLPARRRLLQQVPQRQVAPLYPQSLVSLEKTGDVEENLKTLLVMSTDLMVAAAAYMDIAGMTSSCLFITIEI